LFWRCESVATICFTERAIAFVALPTKLIIVGTFTVDTIWMVLFTLARDLLAFQSRGRSCFQCLIRGQNLHVDATIIFGDGSVAVARPKLLQKQ
jgi:hypothetical protein